MFTSKGRGRCVIAVGVSVGMVLAIAACGSSSPKSASSSGSSSSATGKPYTVGQIGTFSGEVASSNVGAEAALTAWADYVNAHGGIKGHPVKLIQKDDQLNASLAQQEAKELVQQDHVMAIVGVSSPVEETWAPYIATTTTPVIGDDLGTDVMEKYKNFFPEGATQSVGYFFGFPKVASVLGHTKLGVLYCAEATACTQIADAERVDATSGGATFVYSAEASSSAPNYTAQCLGAKKAGATAVALLFSSQVATRVAQSCVQQGYDPLFIQGANSFAQSEDAAPAINGVAGPVPVFPWFASANPAMKLFQAAMHQYEPSVFTASGADGYSSSAAQAWASAEIFEAAAENLPSGESSGADLIQQLYKLPKGDTFGGLTPPLTYEDTGGPQPLTNCFFGIRLVNGKWTSLDGAKAICK